MVQKNRLTVLNALRGTAIIAMIVYHILWDLVNIFGVNMPWFGSKTALVIQLSIRWAFILISGFSWHLGRRKLKRSLIVIGASAIITLVTYIFMPEELILFGVLSFMCFAMLSAIPLAKLFEKIPPYIGISVSALFFTLTYNIPRGYVGFGDFVFFELPDFLYMSKLTAFFGFPSSDFFSTDYVPFFPWVFLFFVGIFLYKAFEKHNLLRFLSAFRVKPLEFIGRHSLIIYMLHQPLVYAILMLLFTCFSDKI